MPQDAIEVTVLTRLSEISAADWDACACPEAAAGARPNDPFTTHRFLLALESSHSVGTGTGWSPRHLVARLGGEVIAVAPLYAKSHSQGEYIFDFNWAEAWERAGGRYYPKLQGAVPFTPASGRRFLTRPGHEAAGAATLLQAMVQLARDNRLSSLHLTFCTEAEALIGAEAGLLHRVTQQFHWENHGYPDFDAFLARGGGAVFIHWAVEGGAQAESLADRIGFASHSGSTRYRHGPVELVFGVMADKDYREILHILSRGVRRVHLCPALTPRSLAPAECGSAAAELGMFVSTHSTCADALKVARRAAGARGLVCATGSFSVVTEVRRLLLGDRVLSDGEEPWT